MSSDDPGATASTGTWHEDGTDERLKAAFAALNGGQPERAATICRQVLAERPDLVPAHFLVGLVALALNDHRTAVAAFGSVTRLDKKHAAAWAQLALLFLRAGQLNRADAALERAVACENGDQPAVHDVLGRVYSQLGDQGQARAWYERAVDGDPANAGFRVNLANALVFLGETSMARSQLDAALVSQPASAQAHWLKAGLARATDDAHLREMDRHLAALTASPRAAAFLHYARGKELEDLERWDAAFKAFAAGAAARRRTIDYDEDGEAAFFEALERSFTAAWLGDDCTGVADPSPIFVVGQPRTGTTLVERIITAHSQVHSAGELQQLGHTIRRQLRYDRPQRYSAQLAEGAAGLDPQRLGEGYLRATRRQRGHAPRFVDKLPTNYLFIPLILKALPRAKIVHLVRDPRDACFSVFKQLFADAYPHSYDLKEMARHFARYQRLMATWRERYPGRFLDVAYEDVVTDTEAQARRLIDHLGLDWESACLEFHRQDAAVTTASAVQVRQPAHTKSVGRWRRYEAQLAPMIDTLVQSGVSF